MGSERPAYMKKIKSMQALAPVAYWDFIDSPIILTFVKYLRPFTVSIIKRYKILYTYIIIYVPLILYKLFNFIMINFQLIAKLFGIYEFLPENDVWRRLGNKLCSFVFQNTCAYFIQEVMGVDFKQFNTSLVPLFTGHASSGSSLKSLWHYGQQIHSGGFFKYDYYNSWENRRRHGADTPPQYKVANVDCKVALYYIKNDRLTSDIDVLLWIMSLRGARVSSRSTTSVTRRAQHPSL